MLYSLVGGVLASLESKQEEYFPRLPKMQNNMSNTIHIIGKVIASHRMSCTRAEAHGVGVDTGLMDHLESSEYVNTQRFYFLSQKKLFELVFEKYGVEGEKKNVTSDDKIRVAGILFSYSELRECIPDMLGKMRGSQFRADLDAASARKLAGYRALFTKFIDQEVIIALPDKWMSEETKQSIDTLTSEGQYEQYGMFHPNNAARIAYNWTQKKIIGIFAKIVLEYQECMKRYSMGTGGGPGAPEFFFTCETRDESYVSLHATGIQFISCSGSHLGQVVWFPFCSKKRSDARGLHD
jgi:hypothetical protein